MSRIKKIFLIILLASIGSLLYGCDPGINDLEEIDGRIGGHLGYDLLDLLDPEECYERLLDELEFMNLKCYYAYDKAEKQAFKILNLYSIADMATDSEDLTDEQFEKQIELYKTIKSINVYMNTVVVGTYSSSYVYNKTTTAINLCNELLDFYRV